MLLDDNDFLWLNQAACRHISNPDIFFPPRDKEVYHKLSNQAKSYCYGSVGQPPCPVRQQCLWQAIKTDEQHGIWGGMSHRERNALVRKWQKQYKNQMTLQEYVFQTKENKNGSN